MKILEAFIEVKLEGVRRVFQQLRVLEARLTRLSDLQVNLAPVSEPFSRRTLRRIAIFRRQMRDITNQMRRFGNTARRAGRATRRVSLAQSLFVRLSRLNLIITTVLRVFRVLRAVGQAAFGVIAAGARLVLAPLLAIGSALAAIVRALPFIAAGFASFAVNNLVQFERRLERIRLLFDQAFGIRAQAQLESISRIAAQFGVDALSAADSFARFAAATRGAGLTLRQQRELFEGVTTAAVALGLESDKVQSIFVALEQIVSKGRISMEELRRQLGNALPGAFSIAARSIGKTNQELEQLIETGELTVDRLLAAFGPQLIKEFAEPAARAANTLNARLARVVNTFNRFRAILSGFVAEPFVELLEKLIETAEKLDAALNIRAALAPAIAAINTIRDRFEQIVFSVQRFVQSLEGPTARALQLFATQLALVVPILTAIVGQIARLINFLAELTGLEQGFRSLFGGINQIKSFADAIDVFTASLVNLDTAVELVTTSLGILVIKARDRIAQVLNAVGATGALGAEISKIGRALFENLFDFEFPERPERRRFVAPSAPFGRPPIEGMLEDSRRVSEATRRANKQMRELRDRQRELATEFRSTIESMRRARIWNQIFNEFEIFADALVKSTDSLLGRVFGAFSDAFQILTKGVRDDVGDIDAQFRTRFFDIEGAFRQLQQVDTQEEVQKETRDNTGILVEWAQRQFNQTVEIQRLLLQGLGEAVQPQIEPLQDAARIFLDPEWRRGYRLGP